MPVDTDNITTRRRTSLFFNVLLVFLAIIATAVTLVWQLVLPANNAIQHATEELVTLEQRVKTLEERPTPAVEQVNIRALEALQDNVQALQKQINEQPDITLLQNTLIGMEQRLVSLEQRTPGQEEIRRLLASLGLYEKMAEEIDRGLPFAGTLNELSALYAGDKFFDEIIAPLKPFANEGIPPVALLQETFSQSIHSSASPAAGETAWDKFKSNIGSLITVRKVGGEHQGTDDASVLARAEAYLSEGDLSHALSELEGLSESAAAEMKDWVNGARARQQAAEWKRQIRAYIFRNPADNG